MPSIFSTLDRFELMADGEDSLTWGDKTNVTLQLIEQLVDGYGTVNVAGSTDVTLTVNNAATDQVRQGVIYLNGTISGNINVIMPQTSWVRVFVNATAGVFTLTIKAGALTNAYTLTQGTAALLWNDGSFGVRNAISDLATVTIANAIIKGGTIDGVTLDGGTF